mmetsp:Transcript_117794/g.293754  ORF Transcript_117794/g.293754 Transcript_117794/m.293754 type:complete len:341 (+) Transcript_117794:387-1409(+)
MFDAKLAVELHALRHEVHVELEERLIEELRKVAGQGLVLLQAAPQIHRQPLRVGDVVIVADLWLLAVGEAEFHIAQVQQPFDQSVGDHLVLLALEVLVVQHAHAAQDADLTHALLVVHRADWSVQRVRNRARRQDRDRWLLSVEGGAVREDELQASVVLADVGDIPVLLGDGQRQLICGLLLLFPLSLGCPDHVLAQDTVCDEALFGVVVLVVDCAHNCIAVKADPELFEQVVNVGVVLALAALTEQEHDAVTLPQEILDGCELVLREHLAGACEDHQVGRLQLLRGDHLFVHGHFVVGFDLAMKLLVVVVWVPLLLFGHVQKDLLLRGSRMFTAMSHSH